jgi:ABC-2 type transport system permease protein
MVGQRKTYFGKLSGGQKQRLSVALALIGNPRVAILDELTTGLGPAARRDVWDLLEDLRGAGVTLLLVSHFMEEAERLCDRVIVIDHGQIIAADTPEGLAASVQADQRMSFLPSTAFDLAVLRALPDVHSANSVGERVIVTGTDNVASAVIIALHGRSISVGKLRVDQPAITLLALQALPDVLTRYREMGVLKRLRTTPVSPALLLGAQLTLILSVAIVCMVLMVVVPPLGGAPWPRNVGGFVITYLLGAWALLGLGMVIASLFHNAKVAAGFGSFLFFVLQFFTGLWVQRPNLPTWLREVSDFTPSGAAVAGLTDSSVGHWPRVLYLIVLAVWGAATSLLAIRFFSWE